MKNSFRNVTMCLMTFFISHFAFAQRADTIAAIRMDSLSVPAPEILWGAPITDWGISSNINVPVNSISTVWLWAGQVPTCSCLRNRDGVFYENGDSIPYGGTCVVLFGSNSPDSVDCMRFNEVENVSSFQCDTGQTIKIISHYWQGKRHGTREYFDKDGKWLKTENYEEGKLISTVYAD